MNSLPSTATHNAKSDKDGQAAPNLTPPHHGRIILVAADHGTPLTGATKRNRLMAQCAKRSARVDSTTTATNHPQRSILKAPTHSTTATATQFG